MAKHLRLLIIEDVETDAFLLVRALTRGGFDVAYERVETAAAMSEALARQAWDIIISDYSMPQFTAPRALRLLQEHQLDLPFIIVSGTVNEEIAVEAMRAGAHDFMAKDKLTRLIPAVERELSDAAARAARSRMEKEVRDTREQLNAILACAPAFILTVDVDGRIRFINRVLSHHEREMVIGTDWLAYMPPEEHDRMRTRLQAVLENGQPQVYEVGTTLPDGHVVWFSSHMGPIRRGDEIVGAVIVAQDVSELKHAQEQLLIADRMASVGMLAAGVAHEVNNPLASLMANLEFAAEDIGALGKELAATSDAAGHAESLARAETRRSEVANLLREATESADRVRHVVRDLKMLSRADEETRGAVDVHRVIDSSIRMARNEIRHRAHVVKEYGTIPPVEGNESRLGQVFLNIIVNAAQAIPEGRTDENEIRIVTRLDEQGRVVIEVHDTGPGISDAVVSRIFDPFFTTKPIGVGSGLGLTICHRIITAHGGQIVIGRGVGTVVRVILPASTSLLPDVPDVPIVAADGRRGRILVVDDEPSLAAAIRRMLATEHDVRVLTRARDAIDVVSGGDRFDVVLCDLMMPDVTGMDLHAELLRVAPEQADKIVFMTGGAFTSRAREFLDKVRNPRVEKPFAAASLKALVRSLLSGA
jgi:PAS domain S-box-containing protein